MRYLTEVRTLSTLAAAKAGTSIRNCIEDHLKNTAVCEYCINCKIKCPDLVPLKNILIGMPVDANDMIYQKAVSCTQLTTFDDDSDDSDDMSLSQNMKFVLTWLFDYLKFSISVLVEEPTDGIPFAQNFGDKINEINYYYRLPDLDAHLKTMLPPTKSSLKQLIFNNKINASTLKTVGEFCTCLKRIQGRLAAEEDYVPGIRNLLFKDPETQLVRNVCCDTLERVGIWLPSSNNVENVKKLEVEAFSLLIQNLPNLSSFISDVYGIDDLLELEVITKVDTVHGNDNFSMEKILNIKKFCPELKVFDGAIDKVKVARLIHTFNKLEILIIRYRREEYDEDDEPSLEEVEEDSPSLDDIEELSVLYDGILSANLTTLKTLFLVGCDISTLYLQAFAKRLENVEKIIVMGCGKVVWNESFFFKSLKIFTVHLYSEEVNFNWMKSFAGTVKSVNILHAKAVQVNLDQIPNMVTGGYPYLEKLDVSNFIYNDDFVKAAIVYNPCFYSIGCFKKGSEQQLKECEQYFKEQNIKCRLVPALL